MPQIITDFSENHYPFQRDTYKIIGDCMEVHRILGHGFLEVVYKDALEIEFKKRQLRYEREKEYQIEYKGIVIPHKFYADFVINENVILEAKSNDGGVAEDSIPQVINYLKISDCKIGLLINFGKVSLEFKRIILQRSSEVPLAKRTASFLIHQC